VRMKAPIKGREGAQAPDHAEDEEFKSDMVIGYLRAQKADVGSIENTRQPGKDSADQKDKSLVLMA